MKKIITLSIAMLMFMAFSTKAQYYYIPTLIPTGSNPGGLNSDGEYPPLSGLPAGWTTIQSGNASSPVWSSTVSLPFTFTFNGTPVSAYKVSTSGVLTFDLGAATAPSYTNASLPDAGIPDSSICVWGVRGTGSSDVIIYKTFGTSPNRQHWVQFNSYSHPNLQQGWTYWSIVLEETTNKIYFVDQKKSCVQGTSNCAGNIAITIGLQVNSTTAYQVTGSPNIQSLCANDGTPADNTYFEFFPGVQPTYNAISTRMNMQNYYALASAPFSVIGTSRNLGTDTIKSMDVNYSVNGGATQTSPLSGLNIPTGNSLTYTHPTAWAPSSLGSYTIKLWTSNLNSNADQSPADDTVSATVLVTQDTVQRIILFEEFTSSTCGPCASANPGYNALLNSNGVNTLGGKGASIKYQMNWPSPGNDPMYIATDGSARKTYYSVTGIPDAILNGNVYSGSPAGITQASVNTEYAKPAYFDIKLSPIYSGNKITIVGSVNSLRNTAGSLVLQVAIVDSHVNHNVETNGETDFYQVFRKMVPSVSGLSLGTQTAGKQNLIYLNTSFTGSEPYLNMADLGIVAFVQDMTTKTVHQAFYADITYDINAGIVKNDDIFSDINIYPNPFEDRAAVVMNLKQEETVTVNMYNVMGELVYTSKSIDMQRGKNLVEINSEGISAGVYLVTVNSSQSSVTRKVTITK